MARCLRRGIGFSTLGCLTILTSCDDAVGPDATRYSIEVVSGDAQVGAPGWYLPDAVRVRVLDRRGAPVPNVIVGFEVLTGGGRASVQRDTTTALGEASVRWALGPPTIRTQSLRMRGGGGSVDVSATALNTTEVDVVIVRGSLGPLRGAVLVEPDSWRDIKAGGIHSDTVIPLPPGHTGELLLLSSANPPARVVLKGTDALDTTYVDLRPPVLVPISFQIFDGDYASRVDQLQSSLGVLQEIWDASGMGLTVGAVEFADSTRAEPFVLSLQYACLEGPPQPDDHLDVWVVPEKVWAASEHLSPHIGWACTSRVLLRDIWLGTPFLLAHEIGHTFKLAHTPGSVMSEFLLSVRHFHDGEVITAHFRDDSTLNWMLDAQPVDQRRNCFAQPELCPPADFDLIPH